MRDTVYCIQCGVEKKQREKEGRQACLIRKFCSLSCSTTWRHKNKPFSLFTKGHKVRVGMKHPESFIINRRGEGNPAWKGVDCTPHGLHTWIRDNFTRPALCELCSEPTKNKPCDWSNKDHKYTRIRSDWQYAHRGCHMRYDQNMGFRITRDTK